MYDDAYHGELGYDARCRPWYMKTIKYKNKALAEGLDVGKVQLMEPYLADDLSVVYVTFTKFVSLDGKDGVASLDINL